MRRVEFWIGLALLAVSSAAAAGQQAGKAPATGGTGAASAAAKSADPNYVIGPQDVLDISVWKEEQLTKTVPVRPDGKISMPLLNDVQAAGLTPTQLAGQITESLKKFVTDPQVTIIVREINSQRIYMLGEVVRAGAYPLLPNMTVLQALSSGGGFTQFANVKKIYVLRVENGKQQKFPFNYKHALESPDENIMLKAGDTIVVP
ncbi:MAG: polysaccharide biosynthesis/export family protein [Candidatus Acidiferrales bacterium]|jgi:polysaccharide export outer membrane protein